MRNSKILAFVIAAIFPTAFAQQQPATPPARATQPPPTGQQVRPVQRFDRTLQALTDEQRTKVDEANKAYASIATPLYTRLMSARRELESLVTADKIDEVAVRAKAKEIGDVEGDLAVARAQRHAKFLGFLTADHARRFSQMSPPSRPFLPSLHDGQTPPPAVPAK
jgi:Spy/CpxP family protein refolding chaperone